MYVTAIHLSDEMEITPFSANNFGHMLGNPLTGSGHLHRQPGGYQYATSTHDTSVAEQSCLT